MYICIKTDKRRCKSTFTFQGRSSRILPHDGSRFWPKTHIRGVHGRRISHWEALQEHGQEQWRIRHQKGKLIHIMLNYQIYTAQTETVGYSDCWIRTSIFVVCLLSPSKTNANIISKSSLQKYSSSANKSSDDLLYLFELLWFAGIQWCLSKPLRGAGNKFNIGDYV